MSKDRRVHEFPGEKIDTVWDGRLCIHVGECTRAKESLFVSGRKPWGQPDLADADVVAEVVGRCPTGALTYRRKDGGPEEAPVEENTITVAQHGPLYAQGDLKITGGSDDQPGVRFRAALCRCGHSKSKPFCDNSHEDVGFQDCGAIGDRGPSLAESGGPLKIIPKANGPLLIDGNVTLRTGSGRAGWQGERTALCRCGASENKPFCDGAHKSIDFTAP